MSAGGPARRRHCGRPARGQAGRLAR